MCYGKFPKSFLVEHGKPYQLYKILNLAAYAYSIEALTAPITCFLCMYIHSKMWNF